MLHPDRTIPETTPDVAALAMERDLFFANAKDLQRQLDAALALLCEHAGADRIHWQIAVSARANAKPIKQGTDQ